MKLAHTFIKYFSSMPDPRRQNKNIRHKFIDVLIISILGIICGADGWTEIQRFGQAKEDWLKTFLELPNGIPSHDVLGDIFSKINPEIFSKCFSSWVASLRLDLKKEIIALDGKSIRGSGNKRQGDPMIHLVSAWAVHNRMMLAQVKTDSKSNEITALPKVLGMIDITGSTVTIDAMGCHQSIAKQILKQGGDYVLSLKKNHPHLYDKVVSMFVAAESNQPKPYKGSLHRQKIETLKDHGRIETRRYTLVSAQDRVDFELLWPEIKGTGKVDITRTTGKKIESSTRYFVSSLPYEGIDDFMNAVRKHWGIEVDLHWSLDVSFREDHCQVRVGHAPENLAILRRIALNLLKKEKTHKNGISCRRKTAGWDNHYLLKVLTADQPVTSSQ